MNEVTSWLNAKYFADAMQRRCSDESICVESFEFESLGYKQYHGGIYRIRAVSTMAKRSVVSIFLREVQIVSFVK